MSSYYDDLNIDEDSSNAPIAVAQGEVPVHDIMAAVTDSGILNNPLNRSAEEMEQITQRGLQSRELLGAASLFAGIRNHLIRTDRGSTTQAGTNIRNNHLQILETIINSLAERVSEAESEKNDKPDPVSKQFLEKSLVTIDLVTPEDHEQTCTICCDTFKNFSVARQTPCLHKFHAACILPWLERKHTCPVCRANFPSLADDQQSKTKELRSAASEPVSESNSRSSSCYFQNEEDSYSHMFG